MYRSIHHDPENYPNPFAFDPDRFMKDGKLNPDVLDPTSVAFGLGRRWVPPFSTEPRQKANACVEGYAPVDSSATMLSI